MTTTDNRPFLSVKEVAARLGVSERTAYLYVRRGVVPAVEVNGLLKVPAGALDRWIVEKENEALRAVRVAP